MDGVFMKFIRKIVLIGIFTAFVFWAGDLLAQRVQLSDSLIRLHVVADSDSEEDQRVKLLVRDKVTEFIWKGLENIPTREEAVAYLESRLPEIENLVNQTLSALGVEDRCSVSLKEEAFDTREYDTFSLPAGVYESLRIEIGDGEGKNWWCVVFPQLCVPATAEGFSEKAVECGYSDSLTGALTGEEEYRVRFFLLDCLGKLENFFFDS